MGSNDWIVPALGVGVIAIGGLFFLPEILRATRGEEETTNGNGDSSNIIVYDEPPPIVLAERPKPLVDLGDLVDRIRDDGDDTYLITDEDFDKLDIGKKDRRWLNRQRKLRDASLERVVYGDNPYNPIIIPNYNYFGGYVNTVSPYGQGQAHELLRLPQFSDQSKVNTSKNTINLY